MPPFGYRKSIVRSKVERLLSPQHLKEYRELLSDPRTTVKIAHAWLRERGYDIGYSAVARDRRRFDQDLVEVRKTAMLAGQFAEASRGGGLAALSDAMVARFQQVLLQRLMRMDKSGDPKAEKTNDFTPSEWLELAKTVAASVNTRRSLEALRADYEDRARQAAEAVERAAGPKKKPLDGVEVANAVRRILGVPLPDEPLPALPERSADLPELAPRRLPPPSDN